MDKTILKNFAVESRKDLMDKIERKISLYYVDEKFDKSINGDLIVLSNDKHSITLTKKQNDNRDNLVRRIHELGTEQVIEESAYTWFNRLVAIRYMEINDYLPLTKDNQSLGFRVLSSQDNTLDPEILKFTNLSNTFLDIDFNPNKYSNLTNTDEKFKYVLLLVCKKLGKVIPQVFDGVTDYIDLLIPDNLLSTESVLDKLIKIPEDNFKEVEVIGWLYQYYNQTEKDRVINAKKQYKKNEIPYATQLFTPDWIVKYMVENSLGRYYIEHNGNSDIINNWKYFIKDNLNIINDRIDVSKLTCIDPCSGSGHILVYMFEILYQMYINEGYSKQDIPELILKNNLYGLDIDDRAGQLSILSVILKAREYDRNIFNKDIIKNLNILSLQESKNISKENIEYLKSDGDDLISYSINDTVNYLVDIFKDAKEIGSLLVVEDKSYEFLLDKINLLKNKQLDILDYINEKDIEDKVKPLLKEAIILISKYDVVVTNPPYMGIAYQSDNLKQYVSKNYYISRTDLSTCFMQAGVNFLKPNGMLGMINIPTWMFLTSFKDLRESILNNYNILCMAHLGRGVFGSDFGTTAFVIENRKSSNLGIYQRLFSKQGGVDNNSIKQKMFFEKNRIYKTNQNEFLNIPGYPLVYWINKNLINVFSMNKRIADGYAVGKKGLSTGNNDLYLRLWYEVEDTKSCFEYDENNNGYKWYPINKGGSFRKWYGNNEYLINWENNGKEIKSSPASVIRNENYYFKESITWTMLSASCFGVRYSEKGKIFEGAGPSLFPVDNLRNYILALLCSNVGNYIIRLLNPTININIGDVENIPLIIDEGKKDIIDNLSEENIKISKNDWNSFETSWDFTKHPLLKPVSNVSTIRDSLNNWNKYTLEQRALLKRNEEELNRLFIEIYGLKDELTPEVDDKDITIRKSDKLGDIKSFISYAIGCMYGRYSLDEEGLIYAGGEWDKSKYKTFIPDNDNIIPIADSNDIFYSDDVVGKFIKFVEITFGKDTLRENLDFIAETLGKKGIETSEETIRRYFLNDFYKDHLQTYQKRPIYWMFDSGKNNGFKCLIYMHRYNEQTISKIKVDYFLKVQESYRNQLAAVQERLNGVNGLTTVEIKELRNKEKDLTDKLKECKDYYEKLDHIANEMIKIDLDDGVKVNYAKFEDILAKIK